MKARHPLRFALTTLSLLGCGSVVTAPADTSDASTADRPPPVETDARPTAAGADSGSVPSADVPSARDASTPDVAAPTGACSGAIPLTQDPVQAAAMERVSDGLIVAWARYGGGVVMVQPFTDTFVPRGPALDLSLLTNGSDTVSLSFSGTSGVLAAGSSMYFLSVGADGQVTLTNRHDYPRRLIRYGYALSPTSFRGALADGAFIYSTGDRMSANTSNAPLDPPHGAGVSMRIDATGGGYYSFEPRDVGGARRLHARRFIFGHGASLEVMNRYLDEASASPLVEHDGSLYRLVYRGAREVDVALERRDPSDLALRGAPVVVHPGAAWSSADGALGVGGSELFMAWSARPSGAGYNSALRAQWRSDGVSTELHANARERTVRVFDAETNGAASRGWALFGERDPGGGFALLGRCVDRRR